MFIGNDIVDLKINRNHHPRFADRAMTTRELAWQSTSSQPEIDLWVAWAAKEAGYKLIKQIDPEVPFELKEFEWDYELSRINYKDKIISGHVEVLCEGQCVHVVCVERLHSISFYSKVKMISSEDASLAVRELAKDLMKDSQEFHQWCLSQGIDTTGDVDSFIEFERSQEKIPSMTFKGRKIPVAVSFSHDGEFVAAALAWAIH